MNWFLSQMSRVDKFSVGDIIVTPFEHDRSWYRARISEILEGDQIDVYYVDFGDSGVVSMDSVKAIRQDVDSKCKCLYLERHGRVYIDSQAYR